VREERRHDVRGMNVAGLRAVEHENCDLSDERQVNALKGNFGGAPKLPYEYPCVLIRGHYFLETRLDIYVFVRFYSLSFC
jgi:hypothetical protein